MFLQKLGIALTMAFALLGMFQNRADAFWGHRHHHHYHHGFYYGGYPSWGFSSLRYTSLSVGFGYPRYRSYYVSHYPTYSYTSFYVPSYYVPTYYCPPVYTAPVYVAPVYYSAPIYSAPVYYAPTCSTNNISTSLVSNLTGMGSNDLPIMANRPAVADTPAKNTLMVSTGKVVVASPQSGSNAALSPLPSELLKSADAIFGAGGYREAAAAYAKLTVHYGNHDSLAVRRFISLVASGQCDQAAVVVELASALDQQLTSDSLTRNSLAQFYGSHADLRNLHIESLADFAWNHQDDVSALKMVGIWLQLDGQDQRAEPFFQRARSLAPSTEGADHTGRLVATKMTPLLK